jgi:hypothetical protein
MSKITLSEICRDLLLDRKNRALLVYSESCKKTLPDIYKFAKKHLDDDANVIDASLSSLTTKEIIIFNDMLQGIISLCKDEWIGSETPVEIINDKKLRKNCSLCNQPNNKWVYNIKNKLTGKTINVGSTCIGHFPSIELMKGKSKSQLEREAERQHRLQILTLKFPGIQKTLERWESELYSFKVLIPNQLAIPYLDLKSKLDELVNKFINKKADEEIFIEIGEILTERKMLLDSIREYEKESIEHDYIATREVYQWLKRKGDIETIEKLKENGYISYNTAPKIFEKNFLKRVIEDINFNFDDLGTSIIDLDDEQGGFIIKPFLNTEFKLICSYEKFLSAFGWVLFGEKRNAALSLINIFKLSRIYGRQSFELTLEKLKEVLRKSKSNYAIQINRLTDYFDENIVDLVDKRKNIIWVIKGNKFLNEFKNIAFELTECDDNDIGSFLDSLSPTDYKRYTRNELKELREAGRNMSRVHI